MCATVIRVVYRGLIFRASLFGFSFEHCFKTAALQRNVYIKPLHIQSSLLFRRTDFVLRLLAPALNFSSLTKLKDALV